MPANPIPYSPSTAHRARAPRAWSCAWIALAAALLLLFGTPTQGRAATMFDVSGCPATNLALGSLTPPFAVRTGTCSVQFGDTVTGSELRLYQADGTGAAMNGFADHAAGANWSTGTTMFGTCLDAVTGGAIASWTPAADGTCDPIDAEPWRPVSASAAAGVVASTGAGASGTATMRFGARGTVAAMPGSYAAPLVIEVISTTVNTPPTTPAMVAPADAAIVASPTPTLTATFSDPDASDTGTVHFEVCSSSTCASAIQTGTSSAGTANGANGSWVVGSALTAGMTYWWRARTEDAGAAVSGWSTPRSFMVNSTSAPTPSSPADAVVIASTTQTLSATFTDPQAGQTGTIAFRITSNAACTTVVQSGSSSAGVAIGANGTWTAAALAPGATYWWCATSTDSAGGVSALSAIRSFTVNSTTSPTLVAPASGATGQATTPSLSATFTDPQVGQTGTLEFRVTSDSGCSTVVGSGSSAAGVGIGSNGSWTVSPALAASTSYWWCARSTDNLGGVSGWSSARSFTTAPAGCTGANTAAPSVTPVGPVNSGTTLTLASNGSWSCTPSSYSYQWYRCYTLIPGATGSTYATVVADRGYLVRVRVTAIHASGNGTADSNQVFVNPAPAEC